MPHVTILRGLPASGKSNYACTLADLSNALIVSADQFFMVDGVYKHNPAQQGEAHLYCWREFKRALDAGVDVVVDNTNIEAHEIAPYRMEALSRGHTVSIVTMDTPIRIALDRNTKRGHKSVPEFVMGIMHARMLREVLPAYWLQSRVRLLSPEEAASLGHSDT